jgi:glycosyltransferase involved in cell wall biosynthesis
MARRVLIVCYEVPGYGGHSSSIYRLHQCLLHDPEFEFHLVFVVGRSDPLFYCQVFGEGFANPLDLERVSLAALDWRDEAERRRFKDRVVGLDPDLVLCQGCHAAALVARSVPEIGMIFFAAGSHQRHYFETLGLTAEEVLAWAASRGGWLPNRSELEREAVAGACLVIANSPLMRDLVKTFHPDLRGRISETVVWSAQWTAAPSAEREPPPVSFTERSIDLLFVASDWGRATKNLPFVRAIARCLPGWSIHVVGEFDELVPGAVHHGLMGSSERLFDLMADSRVLACPSTMDSAPCVVYEGGGLGCNVVASRNLGNFEACPPELLVPEFTPSAFVERIRIGREQAFPNPPAPEIMETGIDAIRSILRGHLV